MNHFKKYGPIYVGLMVLGVIITLYIWKTSKNLPYLSANRQDWNDIAEFMSFLVNPIIAFAAVYLAWRTIQIQKDHTIANFFTFESEQIARLFFELKSRWANKADIWANQLEFHKEFAQIILGYLPISEQIFRKNSKLFLGNSRSIVTRLEFSIFDFLRINDLIAFHGVNPPKVRENVDPILQKPISDFLIEYWRKFKQ